MKRLSLILIAALMIGCSNAEKDEDGRGEDGASRDKTEKAASEKAPFEVEVGKGVIVITSLEDGLVISKIVANRGNCLSFWSMDYKDSNGFMFEFKFNAGKNGNMVSVSKRDNSWRLIEELTIEDFYTKYGKDKALRLDFGNRTTISTFCNPVLEVQIDTNKGAWTFSFR